MRTLAKKVLVPDTGWLLLGLFHCWWGLLSDTQPQVTLGACLVLYALWPERKKVRGR